LGALYRKSIKISSENPNFFEAQDLYLHIKMRKAMDIKTHTTPTQPLEYTAISLFYLCLIYNVDKNKCLK